MNKKFYIYFKTLCLRNDNISLLELSKRTGLTYPTIYSIAHGETNNPTLKNIGKICDALNESIDNFVKNYYELHD